MKHQYYHGQKHKSLFDDKEYTVVLESPDLDQLSLHASYALSGLTQLQELTVNAGLALVHENDNYSRKVGRATATAAMKPLVCNLKLVNVKEEGRIHFVLVPVDSKIGAVVLEFRKGKSELHLIQALLKDSADLDIRTNFIV